MMAQRFTDLVSFAANWRGNYPGDGASRIKSAIRELKRAIKEAETHPEIGDAD